jgi:hypothetical protein
MATVIDGITIDVDREITALNLSERFGSDLPSNKLLRYKSYDGYIFFKCEEKYLYDEYDYLGDNPTMIFVVPLDSYFGELQDEIKPANFKWDNKSLKKLCDDYDKPYIISNRPIKGGRELTYYCKDGSTYKTIKKEE